jgi:hypothetical protein
MTPARDVSPCRKVWASAPCYAVAAARAVFPGLTWSPAAARKTEQDQEAAASVPARPITYLRLRR